jgi:uncharacterized protein YciI
VESSPTDEYVYVLHVARPAMLTEGPTASEAEAVSGHWDYVVDLHQKGIAVFVGRTALIGESAFGIVVFKADSAEKAAETMRADPAIARGVMRGEVFPFQVYLK